MIINMYNRVLIFGTGKFAERFCIENSNLNIIGFLDNDMEKVGKIYRNKTIYSVDEIKDLKWEYIIICSSYWKEILKQLILMNINNKKIIIASQDDFYRELDKWREINDTILNNHISKGKLNNPVFYNYDDMSVTTKIPMELIFTEDLEVVGKTYIYEFLNKEQKQLYLKYKGISLARSTPHIELFKFYKGDNIELPYTYLNWYRIATAQNNLTDEEILVKRHKEYVFMKQELDNKSDYFEKNPAKAVWNPKRACFNLSDGHHRAAFLYTQGEKYIQVKINIEDFNSWLNKDVLLQYGNRINQYMEDINTDNNLVKIYTPILHPSNLMHKVERDTVFPERYRLIMEHLQERELNGAKIIDIGCAHGFYCRLFEREGAEVTGIEIDKRHVRFGHVVNKLEQINFKFVEKDFLDMDEGNFEIGIMFTVLYHYLNDEDKKYNFLYKLDKCVDKMLFWESGDDPIQEKDLILKYTSFRQYHRLGTTIGTGKVRELGVFLK